jgi:hypothetical protein
MNMKQMLIGSCLLAGFTGGSIVLLEQESPPTIAWDQAQACQLKVVAIRIAQESRYFLEEISTGAIFIYASEGAWQKPVIALGGTMMARCAFDMNVRYTDHVSVTEVVEKGAHNQQGTQLNLPSYGYLLAPVHG